jgi:hypothetical protein
MLILAKRLPSQVAVPFGCTVMSLPVCKPIDWFDKRELLKEKSYVCFKSVSSFLLCLVEEKPWKVSENLCWFLLSNEGSFALWKLYANCWFGVHGMGYRSSYILSPLKPCLVVAFRSAVWNMRLFRPTGGIVLLYLDEFYGCSWTETSFAKLGSSPKGLVLQFALAPFV